MKQPRKTEMQALQTHKVASSRQARGAGQCSERDPRTFSNASARGGGWLRSSAHPGKAPAMKVATSALAQIIISAMRSIMGSLALASIATGCPRSSSCGRHKGSRRQSERGFLKASRCCGR